jgi:hypothetical protein
MVICYNEIMIVALFMAAIAFSLLYCRTGRVEYLVLGATSLGIFLGSDFLSLLYTPLAVGFLVLLMVFGKMPLRRIAGALSLFAAMLCLLGCFWYIRNYIFEGNPFFPLTVSLFGRTIFEGPQVFSQINPMERYLFVSSLLDASGKIFGVSLAISLGFCSVAVVRARRWMYRAVFLVPVFILAGWHFLLPGRELRYLMFVPPFGAIAAGYLIENSAKREKSVLLIMLAGFLMLQSAVWLPGYWHVIWVLSAILAGVHHRHRILEYCVGPISRLAPKTVIASAIALVFVSMLLMPGLCEYRDAQRFTEHYKGKVGEAWEWIDNNTDGDRIAYTGTNKSYPLYRSNVSNYVTYIETGLGAGEAPREDGAFYDAWICRMLSADIGYLFVCRMDSSTYMETSVPYPIEKRWADMHPELFRPKFTNDYVTIYTVDKSQAASSDSLSRNSSQ